MQNAQSLLFQIALTAAAPRVFPDPGEHREQNGSQNRDYCDYNKEFYQGETGATRVMIHNVPSALCILVCNCV